MNKRKSVKIQSEIFLTMILLVSVMATVISVVSIFENVGSERARLDENLGNIAFGISTSDIVKNGLTDISEDKDNLIGNLLDSTKASMANLDVISVVDTDNIRRYHTNPELKGTVYDGTIPDFGAHGNKGYVESNVGPSGSQRRAYAPVFDGNGRYVGFVMAVMLNSNIKRIVSRTIYLHLIVGIGLVIFAGMLSFILSKSIKNRLHGYEPDTFSNMFNIRDNVLASLDEGILAVDENENILYMNTSAKEMLKLEELSNKEETVKKLKLKEVISSGEKNLNVPIHFVKGSDILVDKIPVIVNEKVTGALVILRDRTELTRIADDLSGAKFLVDSMRANNHEFNNKLHVILGLIQMGNTREASDYISNLTSIKQNFVQRIAKCIEDPSVGALLIGKSARCAELNVSFTLEKESHLYRDHISLPSGDIVTIIGNLVDNSLDSLNVSTNTPKELTVGIYTEPHAMIISVDDTGTGIREDIIEKIYEKGFSTKGEGRGTGLYLISKLIDKYGGSITVDSEEGMGTSFTVTLTDEEK